MNDGLARGLSRLRNWLKQVPRIGLLVYGLALGVASGWDLFFADDFDVRMAAASLGCAALVTVVGCAVRFTNRGGRRPRIWLALAADIFALLTSVALIIVLQSNFTAQPRLEAARVILAVAALVALGLALHDALQAKVPVADATNPGRPESPMKAALAGSALGAVGALLGTSLTFAQFWYTARYQPSTAEPVVTVENRIKPVSGNKSQLEIAASVTVKNTGKTPIKILVSMYQITGTDVRISDTAISGDTSKFGKPLSGNYGPAARYNAYATYPQPELIQAGPVSWDNAWLGPGETTRADLLVQAARGKFNLLRLTTDLAIARADRVEIAESSVPKKDTCERTDIMLTRRRIAHAGVLDRLTNSDRELVTFWATGGEVAAVAPWWPRFPWVGASLHHLGNWCEHGLEGSKGSSGLEGQAMLGWSGAVAEAGVPAS
ncbi:hypothetical protein ACFWWT_48880 [Streptomyces sp. NPDC058676]|uniref:hypothetical protein n=1 Tax=unclassified Streptomyces TaxID=2593676 RepID=UPI00365D02E5